MVWYYHVVLQEDGKNYKFMLKISVSKNGREMNKGKIFIICFLLFFSSLYEDNKCYAFINSSCIVVPKEGQNFFKQNYKDLILSVNEYQDIFGVKINDVDNLFIGDTFVIYHLIWIISWYLQSRNNNFGFKKSMNNFKF